MVSSSLWKLAEFGWGLHRDADGAAQERVEGVDPEDLGLEDYAEVAGDGFGDGVEVEFSAEFFLHRGHRLGRDAAGDDQVEVAEIGVHVEGEAVRGDEAGDVDADGGEFGFGSLLVSALCRFSTGRPKAAAPT